MTKEQEEKERIKNIARFLMNPTMENIHRCKIKKKYNKPKKGETNE